MSILYLYFLKVLKTLHFLSYFLCLSKNPQDSEEEEENARKSGRWNSFVSSSCTLATFFFWDLRVDIVTMYCMSTVIFPPQSILLSLKYKDLKRMRLTDEKMLRKNLRQWKLNQTRICRYVWDSELNVDNWNDNCEAKSEAKSPRPLRGLQVDFSLTRDVSYAVR